MDEFELTPQFRVEYFLDEIVNSTDCPYEARDRIEMYLERIAGADIVTPPPMYRIEFYLAKIAGDNVEIPAPQHRAEFYLAAICGEEVELPEPHDRIDYWLYQWAEGGSLPWQTFVGNPLQFNAPKAHTLRSVSVAFSPKQDLHGYSNPWPAGGGKNKFDKDTLSQASAYTTYYNSYMYSDVILLKPNTHYTMTPTSTSSLGVSYYFVVFRNNDASDPSALSPTSADFRYVVNNGNPTKVQFTTGATGAIRFGVISASGTPPVPNETALNAFMTINYQLEEGNTATSWTPYSNLCPISGWNSLDIYGAGENLAPRQTGYNSQGGTIESTYISTTTDDKIISSLIPVTPNTAYVIKREKSGGMFRWFFFDREPVLNVTTAIGGYYSNQSNTEAAITTPANARYMFVLWTRDQDCGNVQVNLGSTASPYAPYTGSTTTLSFPSTVYGGTASVAEDGSGSGEKRWSKGTIKSVNSVGESSAGIKYAQIDVEWNGKPKSNGIIKTEIYKNSNDAATNNAIRLITDYPYAYDNRFTDLETAKSILVGMDVVYELADYAVTPFTVTPSATPTAVQGINTMWTDVDNLTVEARAEAVNLNALQSLNMLLGGRYVNNHTDEDLTDEEALDVILGGQR